MEHLERLTFFIILLTAIGTLLSLIAVWSPRAFLVKVCAVACAILIFCFGYVGFADLLGRPKPVKLEWAHKNASEVSVPWSETREGDGIYFVFKIPDENVSSVDKNKPQPPPIYYFVPWNEAKGAGKKEGDDKEAKREGEKTGTGEAGEDESSGEDRSKGLAEQLQDARRELEMAPQGTELMMRNPFEQSVEADSKSEKFYLKLPPAPPPKGPLPEGPEIFEHPDTDMRPVIPNTIQKL